MGPNRLVAAALAALLTVVLDGCGSDPLSPGGSSPSTPAPAPAPAPSPAAPTAPTLKGPQLARRMALDLTQSLPVAQDVTTLTNDATQLPALVGAYLAAGSAGRALAALHPRMWGLDSRKLPDLDAMAPASGNAALQSALTPDGATRLQIVQEPALYVRHVVEHHLPFSEIFNAGYTLSSPPLLSLWNLTPTGDAFLGEPTQFATYPDGRPASGLLSTPGLLAAFPSRSDPALRQRTAAILGTLLCLSNEGPAGHAFTDLTATELQSDLATLAATRTPCTGCHAPLDSMAAAYAGLGSTTPFSPWLTYTAPATPVTGTDAGQSFTGLAGLAASIAADTRAGRCELTRLAEAVYQRPLATEADVQALAKAVDALGHSGGDLAHATQALFASPEYGYAVIPPSLSGPVLRQSSGVRILSLAQWQGLVAQLAPGATPADLSDDLDPGHDEAFTATDMMPTGAYWHRVDRLAREVATAIVATELADGVPAATRRLLTDLPDGAGNSASTAVIQQQLIDLWKRLTTVTLAATDTKLQQLLTLWGAALAGSDAASFRAAWTTVLVAMLTDPTFLTY